MNSAHLVYVQNIHTLVPVLLSTRAYICILESTISLALSKSSPVLCIEPLCNLLHLLCHTVFAYHLLGFSFDIWMDICECNHTIMDLCSCCTLQVYMLLEAWLCEWYFSVLKVEIFINTVTFIHIHVLMYNLIVFLYSEWWVIDIQRVLYTEILSECPKTD